MELLLGVILVILGISGLFSSDAPSASGNKSDTPGFGTLVGIVCVFAGIMLTAKTASSPTEPTLQPISFTAPSTPAPTPVSQETPRSPATESTTPQVTGYRTDCQAQEGWINLRQKPGFSPVVAQIPCNADNLTVLGRSVRAEGELWTPVQVGRDRGWVAKTRLTSQQANSGS